jgi:2,4-dienoyl-CoA reductase-like NADH-dependent reductase (Old Yellow Enzyme family)
MKFRKIADLNTVDEFLGYINERGISLPFDIELTNEFAPAHIPVTIGGKAVGNRFCVLPMEGWDCEIDGRPGELTKRRWRRFGQSGAKLIWGGEACAVCHEGKSNPRQLLLNEQTEGDIAKLRELLVQEHRERFTTTDDLLVGLQLTHSGRFSRPNDNKTLESKIAYHHPLLDKKFNISPDAPCLTDGEVQEIIRQYIATAKLAWNAGFDFVDIKHCHGYLGHEFLSAFDRLGVYGGSFENRTRFLREISEGIAAEVPAMIQGIRISLFDWVPFRKNAEDVGEPDLTKGRYDYAFGGDGTGLGMNLTEPLQLIDLCKSLGITAVCATVGSPYYNPHIQRPAMFPPSDGYKPPEDPLAGVARQIACVTEVKKQRPGITIVGSGYTYLQEWLPNVAHAVLRTGSVDFIGLGRMMLPYPDIFADMLEGKALDTKRICRTISDCTTAPRHGLVSGCYPLDKDYQELPDQAELRNIKARQRKGA